MWSGILSQNPASGRNRKHIIANAIVASIRNNKLPAGSLMPTIREVATYLNVSKSVIEGVWAILRNYELIHTHVGLGTYVVEKPHKVTEKPTKEIRNSLSVGRKIYFNKISLPIQNGIMHDLHRELMRGYTCGVMIDTMKNIQEILQVIGGKYAEVFNMALCTAYKPSELYYSQNYEQMINQICQVLIRPHRYVVMADTTSLAMQQAIMEAGFDVKLIKTDQDGILIESLEEILKTGRVRMLYLRSRSLLPFKQFLSDSRILRLLDLEREYKFFIIEDDRYGCFYRSQPHLLMEMGYKKNARIIYISSLSCMHPELNEVNLVAAKAKISRVIIEHFQRAGHMLRLNMICSINRLLENKIITKSEHKFKRDLGKMMTLARGLLVKSDLWDHMVLDAYEGWFFYLRLKRGYFPQHICTLLADEQIFVECAAYKPGYNKINSIVISMAGYLDPMHLNEDINRLNSVINKYVIGN